MNILKRVRFQKNLIIENSMNPSLLEGDEILLKKIFFKYVPNRFDIVKVNLGKLSYIKRVIGLPNENLKLNNNMVYINNVNGLRLHIDSGSDNNTLNNKFWVKFVLAHYSVL